MQSKTCEICTEKITDKKSYRQVKNFAEFFFRIKPERK